MTRFRLVAILMVLGLAAPLAGSAQEAPGWFKVPGTDTQIKFNGFAEASWAYNFLGQTFPTGKGEVYSNTPAIALDNNPLKQQAPNYFGAEVFYSRFGFNTKTPSSAGEIGVRIEGDFNSGSPLQLAGTSFTHKGGFRVRHAYGTVGDWLLLGQTWSTFADLGTFPDQQDENPTYNLAAIRAPMVRVSFPAGPVKVSLAAEDPYFNSLATKKFQYPDFVARIDVPTSMAAFSIRGVTKQFKTAEPGSVSKQGFGGAVGAAIKVGGDTLVLDAEGGTGLGAYQYGTVTGNTNEDVVQIKGGDLKLFTSVGASAGYTHVWSPQFRSNVIGAGVWFKDDPDVRSVTTGADANQRMLMGILNTYWTFAKNAWVGAEFWYNYRKTFDGVLGHETRILLTSHFDFM